MYFSFSRLCERRRRPSRRRAAATACGVRGPGRRCRSGAGRPPRRPVGRPPERAAPRPPALAASGRVAGNIAPSGSANPGGAGAGARLRPGGARRVRHLGAARGGVDVHDDGQVDGESEVAAQRVTDRSAQDPLDRVLGELARGGQQRGAVDETERAGEAQERALLRRQCGGTGARRGTGQIRDHAVPHVRQLAGLIGHVRTPFDVPGGTAVADAASMTGSGHQPSPDLSTPVCKRYADARAVASSGPDGGRRAEDPPGSSCEGAR